MPTSPDCISPWSIPPGGRRGRPHPARADARPDRSQPRRRGCGVVRGGRARGPDPADEEIGRYLREQSLPVVVVANKAEGSAGEHGVLESYAPRARRSGTAVGGTRRRHCPICSAGCFPHHWQQALTLYEEAKEIEDAYAAAMEEDDRPAGPLSSPLSGGPMRANPP